jgi:hypothetical protein
MAQVLGAIGLEELKSLMSSYVVDFIKGGHLRQGRG